MGDPKFPRPKWSRPSRPWQADRIKSEDDLIRQYGLKNKREVWRTESQLRHWRQRARDLQAETRYENPQAEKEVRELLGRLAALGLLPLQGATLDDVLSLTVDDLLERRLQTLVYRRGLAHTVKQARQFLVHGHVAVGDRRVTIPGYLVRVDEEEAIRYHPRSELAHEAHPARPSRETVLERERMQEAAD